MLSYDFIQGESNFLKCLSLRIALIFYDWHYTHHKSQPTCLHRGLLILINTVSQSVFTDSHDALDL